MIRKLNYTNRLKILRDSVQIFVEQNGKIKSFDAVMDFNGLDLPDDAKIYIEPYYKSNYMRFYFGTIQDPRNPHITELSELAGTDVIYFRVKIVDEQNIVGRILAMVSGLRPVNTEREPANRQSILAVNYDAELGQRLYHLEFENIDTVPILELNRKIENLSDLVRSDLFKSTIYPSVIQQVASEIVFDNSYDADPSDDLWQGYWLQYFRKILGIVTPKPNQGSEDEIKMQWIEEVVVAYCNKYRVRSIFSSLDI